MSLHQITAIQYTSGTCFPGFNCCSFCVIDAHSIVVEETLLVALEGHSWAVITARLPVAMLPVGIFSSGEVGRNHGTRGCRCSVHGNATAELLSLISVGRIETERTFYCPIYSFRFMTIILLIHDLGALGKDCHKTVIWNYEYQSYNYNVSYVREVSADKTAPKPHLETWKRLKNSVCFFGTGHFFLPRISFSRGLEGIMQAEFEREYKKDSTEYNVYRLDTGIDDELMTSRIIMADKFAS